MEYQWHSILDALRFFRCLEYCFFVTLALFVIFCYVQSRQLPRGPLAATAVDHNASAKSPSAFTFKEKQMYFAKEIENQPDDLLPTPAGSYSRGRDLSPSTGYQRESVPYPQSHRSRSPGTDRDIDGPKIFNGRLNPNDGYQPRLESYRNIATYSEPKEGTRSGAGDDVRSREEPAWLVK